MKKANIYFLLLFISSFYACKNELVTVDAWKDIPVVYGILNMNDTTTYIRVEKAFVDKDKTPFQLAQIPDSLYYSDITVTLVRVRNNERFVLTRVDGNTEGYPRADGLFAKSPNYLYKAKNSVLSLKADEEWRIEVQRKGETKLLAKSTTKIIGDYEVTNPANTPVFLRYDNNFTFTVQTDEKSGRVYDVKLIFNYDETDPTKPNSTVAKQVKWDFITSGQRRSSNSGPDPIVSLTRKGQELYEYLGKTIPETAGIARTFKSIELEAYIGGQEFLDYLNVGIANTGITGSQTIPTYTNVENGYGIFTSRNKTIKKDVKLSEAALDLLKTGEFTKKLNFR